MSAWTMAGVGLLPPLLLAVVMAGRGAGSGRLVAIQLASSAAVFAGVALSFVSDQSSSIDVPLALALLSFPATLLYALFHERWL